MRGSSQFEAKRGVPFSVRVVRPPPRSNRTEPLSQETAAGILSQCLTQWSLTFLSLQSAGLWAQPENGCLSLEAELIPECQSLKVSGILIGDCHMVCARLLQRWPTNQLFWTESSPKYSEAWCGQGSAPGPVSPAMKQLEWQSKSAPRGKVRPKVLLFWSGPSLPFFGAVRTATQMCPFEQPGLSDGGHSRDGPHRPSD